MQYPVDYEEPLFRPPSEAYSLIFQVTIGCSWNKCTFCEMYSTKDFRVKKEEDVLNEIREMGRMMPDARKIFLADGDAMILSTARLLKILEAIKQSFPRLQRVSSYALPRNLLSKSEQELKELYDAGLKIIYVGIETGDDELLLKINKGETFASTCEGMIRAHTAGIQSSVMILTGLGGKSLSRQHAINSAKILNEIQPHFASTLVLSYPFGKKHFINRLGTDFEVLSKKELLEEQILFLQHCELEETIFRSDHASNYLALKGILNRDKERLITQLENALNHPGLLRPEWMRGL
jgi:radical SAM superfamily enzyme YgiQ (UPF0313 family)